MLTAARELAPERPDVAVALGRVLLLDGDYAAAADQFKHALALRPGDALTRADLAAAQFEMGDRLTAETTLRAVVKADPKLFGRAVHALARASHGRFFLRPSATQKFLAGDSRPKP